MEGYEGDLSGVLGEYGAQVPHEGVSGMADLGENRAGGVHENEWLIQMRTISENLHAWNATGPARETNGLENSAAQALWWFVIYPRIHRFLPVATVLEIAAGYGR